MQNFDRNAAMRQRKKYWKIAKDFMILAAFFCHSLPAQAAELGQAWQPIVQRLLKNGIRKIGAFDIENFLEEAESVKWKAVPPSQIGAIAAGRKSAFYVVKDREVSVSTELPKEGDPAALELHEQLGATGYNDKSGNLSSSIIALSLLPEGSEQIQLAQVLGSTLFLDEQMLSGSGTGSGTSVGGGGDIIALTAKNQFVQRLLRDPKWRSISTIAFLMNINFEPFYDPEQQYVAFRYQSNSGKDFLPYLPDSIPGVLTNPRSGYQDQVTVYIPVLKWGQQPQLRAGFIEKAVAYVQFLIPVAEASFRGKTESYSCGSQKVSFLKNSSDELISMVQKSRFAVLTGCSESDLIMEVRHPAFFDYQGNQKTKQAIPDEEQKKLSVGICLFELKGKALNEPFQVVFKKGEASMAIDSLGIASERDLVGAIHVNEEGLIKSLELAVKGPGWKTLKGREKKLKTPASSAHMELEALPGTTIQFRCEMGAASGLR